jgi:hypothetical protein
VKNSKSGEIDAETIGREIKGNLEDEVDALFKLPIAEFTSARNDLAARLKRGPHPDEAKAVKALAKPSVTAWAVNQLYWNHREAFDRLLAAGQRFHKAQTSGSAAQPAEMRESLEARREALSVLSELAASLLRDAGHNPTPDTIHRITTSLEALSAYASLPDGPAAGRLTRDVDPPGFEALASLVTGAGTTKVHEEMTPVTASQESGGAATPTVQEAPRSDGVQSVREPEDARRAEIAAATVREIQEAQRARIAAVKVSLQDAEKSLTEAKARAERLEAAQKKADEEAAQAKKEAGQAEKELREAGERLQKANAASREAVERLQSIAAEAKEAVKAMEDAWRNVEETSKELKSLFQESEAR